MVDALYFCAAMHAWYSQCTSKAHFFLPCHYHQHMIPLCDSCLYTDWSWLITSSLLCFFFSSFFTFPSFLSIYFPLNSPLCVRFCVCKPVLSAFLLSHFFDPIILCAPSSSCAHVDCRFCVDYTFQDKRYANGSVNKLSTRVLWRNDQCIFVISTFSF